MRLRLREVRERKLMTQTELADRAGLTLSTISRLENDLQRPRISTARVLAEALGVQPEDLIVWGAEEAEEREAAQSKKAAA